MGSFFLPRVNSFTGTLRTDIRRSSTIPLSINQSSNQSDLSQSNSSISLLIKDSLLLFQFSRLIFGISKHWMMNLFDLHFNHFNRLIIVGFVFPSKISSKPLAYAPMVHFLPLIIISVRVPCLSKLISSGY